MWAHIGHLRFVRKVWRKSRPQKGADWPLWIREQEMVHELFRTMQPFEDEYDVGKAWGTDATCKNMGFN